MSRKQNITDFIFIINIKTVAASKAISWKNMHIMKKQKAKYFMHMWNTTQFIKQYYIRFIWLNPCNLDQVGIFHSVSVFGFNIII